MISEEIRFVEKLSFTLCMFKMALEGFNLILEERYDKVKKIHWSHIITNHYKNQKSTARFSNRTADVKFLN